MTDVHPDDEDLSAHLDGEEPLLRDHIEGCSSCTSRLDELSRVRTALAIPVPAPPSWQRDAAIASALRATAGESAEPWYRGFATRAAGVAAALLLVIGAAFAITQLSESNQTDQKVSGGAATDAGATTAAPSAAPPGDLGDLGELADSAALRAIVEPKVAEFARDSAVQRLTPSSPAPALGTAAENGAQKQRAGGLVCDGAARALDPRNVGPTETGIATWQGTPASVLVYSVQGQPGAVHLYVLARTDCRVLEFQSYKP